MKKISKLNKEIYNKAPGCGKLIINLGNNTIQEINLHMGRDNKFYTDTMELAAYLEALKTEIITEE